MGGYREYMRRKLLEELYDKMDENEKRTFVQLTMQDKDHKEIMDALNSQKADIEQIKRKQNWITDFGSDVAANFLTDGIIWLGARLFRKL